MWSYHYEFTVAANAKDLSHIIFEVSPTFTSDDLIYSGSLTAILGSYSSDDGSSNPGMPGILYGIKFEDLPEDTKTWVIEFTSPRVPVWGDFYAVDGKQPGDIAYAYNKGFTLNDVDEMTNHIAVPDTLSYVPVPGAMLLGALGLGAAGLRLRRSV